MGGRCAYNDDMPDLFRHIAACNNAVIPGERLPFRLGGVAVGWVLPDLAGMLLALGAAPAAGGVDLPPALLDPATRALSGARCFRWRDEAFDVRAHPDGPVLAQMDRGALPALGIAAEGVHVNGLVERPDGPWMWLGRRAADKLLDPGKLDHIVGGGVSAGLTPSETLVKEAGEEAAIPPALAASAQPVATLSYAMDRPEGLRRDRLHCYDLLLPDDFVPYPRDGEVEAFELWPLPRVMERVRDADDFKFNVNLVLIDLGLRRGLIGGTEGRRLRAALDRQPASSPG
jgi:8-oxo-dGTP pyrophosphatase MutT (NUDIX family)